MGVPGTATFAELLETELNCTNVPPRTGHASGAWNRPLTTPLFVFERPRAQDSTTRLTEIPPAPPQTPLSAREKHSLTALNRLGADLGECLSPSVLRRAFRRLARRYHPDRHPGSSAAELVRLARLFAEATEHYRVLAAALARSG
jgi:hypothetical protein